jgi:hypothetical protein
VPGLRVQILSWNSCFWPLFMAEWSGIDPHHHNHMLGMSDLFIHSLHVYAASERSCRAVAHYHQQHVRCCIFFLLLLHLRKNQKQKEKSIRWEIDKSHEVTSSNRFDISVVIVSGKPQKSC